MVKLIGSAGLALTEGKVEKKSIFLFTVKVATYKSYCKFRRKCFGYIQ